MNRVWKGNYNIVVFEPNEHFELYGVWKHGCDYCVLHKINVMKILSCMVCRNTAVILCFINKCNENLELYGVWKYGCNTVFYINICNENLELYGVWKYGCNTVFYINICNENLVLYGVWKHGCDYCICNENLVLYGAVITVFYVK